MRPACFAIVLLLVPWVAVADPPPPPPQPLAPLRMASLDGQLLVAGRGLADPNFKHCVVFMLAHTEDGAMGLVVNRVFGGISLKALFGDLGIKKASSTKIDLHYGGPVDFQRGFVLHSDDYAGAATQMFRNGIALSMGVDIVRAVADGRGPKRLKFLAGYSGWSAGQLEHEIARGDWLVAPADPELIFAPAADSDSVWDRALQRAGIAL